MEEYLLNPDLDPSGISLPFSVRPIGIYHDILFSDSKELRRRTDLIRILEAHQLKGPFGSTPSARDPDILELQKYIQKRKNDRKEEALRLSQKDDLLNETPSSPLSHKMVDFRLTRSLLVDLSSLQSYLTPPPARRLAAAIFQLEMSPWAGLLRENFPRANQTQDESHSLASEDSFPSENESDPLGELTDISSEEEKSSQGDRSLRRKIVELRISQPIKSFHPSLIDSKPVGHARDLVSAKISAEERHTLFTPTLTKIAVALQQVVQEAALTRDSRARIRGRLVKQGGKRKDDRNSEERAEACSPLSVVDALPIPWLPINDSENIFDLSSIQQTILSQKCWIPRVCQQNSASTDMPIHRANDIGRRGSFIQFFKRRNWIEALVGSPRVRFAICDGTSEEGFLKIYSNSEEVIRDGKTPRLIQIFNAAHLVNAEWNSSNNSLKLSGFEMKEMAPSFFEALQVNLKFMKEQEVRRFFKKLKFRYKTLTDQINFVEGLRQVVQYGKDLHFSQ